MGICREKALPFLYISRNAIFTHFDIDPIITTLHNIIKLYL